MKHSDKWYQRRLAKYFDTRYADYEDDIVWFTDPAPNQWLFDIPKRNIRVEITCNDNGAITEQIYSK